MRVHNGNYECVQCGAALELPADSAPLVTFRTSNGANPMRIIMQHGIEIHSCPVLEHRTTRSY